MGYIITLGSAIQLLKLSEALGGHTGLRHVGKSKAYLMERWSEGGFGRDPHEMKIPSGFMTLRDCAAAAVQVLKNARDAELTAIRNGNRVSGYLRDPSGDEEIRTDNPFPVQFAFGNMVRVMPTDMMAMAIQHSESSAARFLIVTFYPRFPMELRP